MYNNVWIRETFASMKSVLWIRSDPHHFAGSGFRIRIDSNTTLLQKISLSKILKIMTELDDDDTEKQCNWDCCDASKKIA
jgi:hypothetical protein